MKKKDYLQQIERGALIGTSVLLLNGVVSCSFDPMDTPPTETTLTKGPGGGAPGGLPGGLPGSTITYYAAGKTPVLNTPSVKSGFMMDYGYFKFQTTIPWGDNAIVIRMNENISGYAKKVTNVEVYGHPWINWFTRGNDLIIDQIKVVRTGGNTQIERDNFPAETVFITVHVADESPIVLSFYYTK